MKKVKIFSANSCESLELSINEWLAENKDIEVAATNITAISSALASTETAGRYVFYIYYTILEPGTEIGISIQNQTVLPMDEIKPTDTAVN